MPQAAPPEWAYVAVGSNIEPHRSVPRALELLRAVCPVRAVSTFYETAAIDRPEQPSYRNGMFALEWSGGARALKFDHLRNVEAALGRTRTDDAYAPRTIDLDIMLLGNLVCREPDLQIPGPEIRGRPFVAVTLCELFPEAVLPDTGERIVELATGADVDSLMPDRALTEVLKEMLDGS